MSGSVINSHLAQAEALADSAFEERWAGEHAKATRDKAHPAERLLET